MSGDVYKILLDQRWSLEDLYVFPRTYEQVYFAVYSLDDDHDDFTIQRIRHSYAAFPWQGGYSAVNFYNQLKFTTRKKDRPEIRSIKYSSPGWIELALVVTVALNVEKIVKSVCRSIKICNATYSDIMKGLHQRKLLRLKTKNAELKILASDLKHINECNTQLAKMLNLTSLDNINERTGHPYRTMKILLSLYRRVKILASYEEKGKIAFTKQADEN